MTRLITIAACLLAVGCGSRGVPAGGANSPRAQENRKLAEASAVAAVVGAAVAEVAVHPELEKKSGMSKAWAWVRTHVGAPPPEPVRVAPATSRAGPPPAPVVVVRAEVPPRHVAPPSGSVLVRERVSSEIPLPTEGEADDAAVEAAAARLTEAFAKLDPPLDYHPSPAAVRSDFLKRDSRVVRPPTEEEKAALARVGYAPDRVYVEYTLEANADQVRDIRSRDRVGGTLKAFALIAAAAGVGFVFLRVDAWSQGYLTSWLAFIAAALTGGAVAAYLFA